MRERRILFAVVGAAIVLLGPAAAAAQEEGYPFRWSNFRIEVAGGFGRIAPGDFDVAAQNETAYFEHYFLNRYAAYDSLYGDAYAVSFVATAGREFRPLHSVRPWGVFLRYQASPTLALVVGLERLRGLQTSDVGLDVRIQDARPEADSGGSLTASYRNRAFTLEAEAWTPVLGAHFGWDLLKFLRTEIFIQGGPVFGDLRIASRREESLTGGDGTIAASSRALEMTGSSTSVAVELGGRIRIKVFPFLDVFGQAGYAFRKLTKIHGPRTIRTVTEAPTPSETVYSLSGTWGRTWETADTSWGVYKAPVLTTEYGSQAWSYDSSFFGTAGASADLSGFQLTAGISLRLFK